MKLTHQGQGHILEQVFFLLLVRHFVDGFFEDFHETGVDSAEDQIFEVGVLRDGFGFFDRINRIAELGGNGIWWIDMEPAVTDSRYRGRCGPGKLRSSSAGIDRCPRKDFEMRISLCGFVPL
jgi:hypothetical protein